MKHIKLLSLSTLVPIAIIPAIATSCRNKDNIQVDENHLLVPHEDEYTFMYMPKPYIETEQPISYAKGEHTFVVNQINKDHPIDSFKCFSDENEEIFDSTNWKVIHNGKDVSSQWECSEENLLTKKTSSTAIASGTVMFKVNVLKDLEFIPEANPD